ncbi:LysM peptidoglycan-binding domain-containing protein [Pedobacter sp. HMF7647]|uniref:LysM peptidoglycan-binding domain-containing protein n=1 Tax=Hufsiella arboris TaxID=2695275 RepID=A0A7K1YBE4_9SPHI|nr:lytic transglycosylase domain-containing protein [Hufsiella arboris]MXV51750.1 LysM peptidoglycan-binding domain-containing protein [Hufsiella arboris]
MIRKLLVLTICILFYSTSKASTNYLTDTNKVSVKPRLHFADSLFIIPADNQPPSVYQNVEYKQRLDSLRKIVPLEYNEYVQNYIDIYLSKRRGDFARMIGLSKYYFPIYEKALKEQNIPEELKYISIIESALDPNAVSRSGATGLWQFMFTTAKGYGLTIDNYVDERKDPFTSSRAAATYFKDAFNQLGDWLLAVASYNCGMGAVSRAVARAGGQANFWAIKDYLPQQTRNYVPAFIATVYLMNYYAKHDILPAALDFPVNTDIVPVNRTISLAGIAKSMNVDAKALSVLNASYKKGIVNGSETTPRQVVVPHLSPTSAQELLTFLNTEAEPAEEPTILLAASPGLAPEIYKVKPNESLESIANAFKIEVQDIKVWNNLRTTRIVPGQKLRLSSSAPEIQVKSLKTYISYKVKPGDTLSTIADKFEGSSVSEIKSQNNLKSTALQPGMILKINKG